LIPNLTDKDGPIPDDTILPDFIDDAINDAADDAVDILNDIGNKIADRIADELGIHEWYSLHVQTGCSGFFTPNATAKGADKNDTSCTRDISMCMFSQNFSTTITS
jgi:hypothetical protein